MPLQCAAVADEDNVGLNYWASGSPPDDPRSEILGRRHRCYDLVLHSLSVFGEQCTLNPARQDLEDVRNHSYELAFSVEDPIFHSHWYDWMITEGMTDALLEASNVKSPPCR